MKIERVGIVTHPGKRKSLDAARDLTAYLAGRNVAVTEDDPDLVLSLGGDGTMLRAAQIAHRADAPLLGVNLGALGYLTEVDAGDERVALQRVFEGDFRIEQRLMLACAADLRGEKAAYTGLNEVLIERSSRYRMVRLSVAVDGDHLEDFNADGVIVATPTGSTAYALSAGGPIVSPRADCLVLVPVSPHRIFARPIVLAPDEVVTVTLLADHQKASLSLDGGLGCDLPTGAVVTVRRHPRSLRLVRLSGPGFVQRLRAKLDLRP